MLSGECGAMQLAMADMPPSQRPASPTPSTPSIADAALPPAACRITLAELQRERSRLTLVDTRTAAERQRVVIQGAIAVEPAEVGNKAFLRDADLVLVGSGLDENELFARCTPPSAAHSVRVLTGGVRALKRAGAGVAGRSAELARLDWVEPDELHRFALRVPNQVVLVDPDSAVALPTAIDAALRVAGNSNASRLVDSLQRLAGRSALRPLVAVTRDAGTAASLRVALMAESVTDVLVLSDGLPAYVNYLEVQQRIAANANLKLIRPCGAS